MSVKLTGNFREDFELVCESKDEEALQELLKRASIKHGQPLLTYEEQKKVKEIFNIEI